MAGDGEFKRKLGERIRSLRHERGLSQTDMLRNFGITLSHYQRIERGALDPRVSTLKRIADAFGVPLATLFDGV